MATAADLYDFNVHHMKLVKELGALHTKRLMDNFETDEIQQEQRIDYKTREITEIFRQSESLLKVFGSQGSKIKISASEQKVRQNRQRSLAKKLQGLSMSFRSTQKVRHSLSFVMLSV